MSSVSVQAQDLPSYDITNIPSGTFHTGMAFDVAQPTGDFGSKVDNGAGFDMWVRWDFTPYFGIGLDWGFINYGNEEIDVCAFTTACRVNVYTTTSNNIWFIGLGPEFALDMGSFRPHLGLKTGLSLFETGSRVAGGGGGHGHDDHGGDSENHLANVGFQWRIDGGVDFKLFRWLWLTTGLTRHINGEETYLIKGGIQDLEGGGIALDKQRGGVNFWTFSVGLSSRIFPWPKDRWPKDNR